MQETMWISWTDVMIWNDSFSLFIVVRNRFHLLKFRISSLSNSLSGSQSSSCLTNIHQLYMLQPTISHQQYQAAAHEHTGKDERLQQHVRTLSPSSPASFEGGAATAKISICLSTLHHWVLHWKAWSDYRETNHLIHKSVWKKLTMVPTPKSIRMHLMIRIPCTEAAFADY